MALARFPAPGIYSLSVYAVVAEAANKPAFLYSALVFAHAASDLGAYPAAFAPWHVSPWRRLRGAATLRGGLERGVEHVLMVAVARRFEQHGSVEPYAPVVLMDGSNHVVAPRKCSEDGCKCEWSYMAGPGEKQVVIAVGTGTPGEGGSLAVLLRYNIVDRATGGRLN